jgi:hypothetical protein
MPMRRIPYIPLLATLALICLTAQTSLMLGSAWAAASPSINKAQLDKAVQEALAKQSGTGGQAAAGGAGGEAAAGSATGGEGLGTSSSFSNLTSGGEEEASAPATSTTSNSATSGGVSSGALLPIFIVGAALLGGIAFLILRDARSVAPVTDALGGGNSAHDRAARMRKRRAKAKAARRQRKRNR